MKLVLLLLCAVCLPSTHSSKVLLIPTDHPGRINVLIIGGQALLRKGHEVHVFALMKYRQKILDAGLVPISWKPEKTVGVSDDPEYIELLSQTVDVGEGVSVLNSYKLVLMMSSRMELQCEEFLSNTELMQQIAKEKYDIALVEGLPVGKCVYILPWIHSIKYITIAMMIPPWDVRVPSLPSIEPFVLNPTTNYMSFFRRLVNLFQAGLIPYVFSLRNDESMLAQYAGNRTERSFQEIYSRSEMFLVHNEILLLDYPRVSAPHYVFLGGMGGTPPKPLESDLDIFVSSADTLVIVSFGSLIKLPIPIAKKLLHAFSKLDKLHFIMRFTGISENVPTNVKVMKWLPQNDLLGHPKTKLFISHGGDGGQLESLFHGVPTIIIPMYGSGFYNAVRVQKRKYGKVLFPADDIDKIISTIREVLEDDTYRDSIQRASKIYRSLPQANETLAFWVDHVLKHGSDHIRPPYMDMPLYKFFMLDLFFFMTVVTVVGIFLCLLCCRSLCSKCHGKQKRVKQE